MNANKQDAGGLPELPEPVGHVHSDYEYCAERPFKNDGWPVSVYEAHQVRAYGELCRAAPAGGDDWAFEGRDWMRPKRDQVPARDSLCQRLQQKCSDWGTYWRAPDAHGVELTVEQALELLRDALGVEVDIKNSAPAGSGEVWTNDENERIVTELYLTMLELRGTTTETQELHLLRAGLLLRALLRKLQQGAESPNSVAKRKRVEIEALGYVCNGVSFMHPDTGRRGLLDDLGAVHWIASQGQEGGHARD